MQALFAHMPGLRAVIRTVRLVIVGDGPERRNLEAMVAETAGIRAPILTGYRPDVDRFYGLFDVFVLNSFAEGMSNTLLEAMASGLPVVCTPVGANPELVRHGERGLHVPVGDDNALASALRLYLSRPPSALFTEPTRDATLSRAIRSVRWFRAIWISIGN